MVTGVQTCALPISTRAIVNVPENTQPASSRATPWLYSGLTSISRGVARLIGTVVVGISRTVDVETCDPLTVVRAGSDDELPDEHAAVTRPTTISSATMRAPRMPLAINDVYQSEQLV